MDGTQVSDARERVAHGIEALQSFLSVVPQLLEENEAVRRQLASMHETIDALRNEIRDLQTAKDELNRERGEMAETISRTMNDMLQLSNELIERLRTGDTRGGFVHSAANGPNGRP